MFSMHLLNRFVVFLAVCTLGACASAGSRLPPLPDRGTYSYVLGTGDKLQIHLYGVGDLDGGALAGGAAPSSRGADASDYIIPDTGRIGVPLIGEVQAAGLTVAQLTEAITTKLVSGYIKDPKVAVEMLTYRPFYIFGEVNHPGSYPYASNLNILSAIATAGGYTYRANEKFAIVERKIDGKIVRGRVDSSAPIHPDDVVRIPERFF
jgi:polysaccharide export outer membrane protein